MLDRKTKDIDANIELLEDRKNFIVKTRNALIFGGCLLASIGILGGIIWGLLEMSFDIGTWFALPFLIGALLVLILCFPVIHDLQYLDLLIYLKRQFERKK